MAKDPAFLFYPGDYLKDTQCLNEKQQVSYDRIMCEHMRNICEHMKNIGISQQRLNFFIKSLSEHEKSELMTFLQKCEAGYQIEWVAISISERKRYTNSRAKNKKGKTKNISKTYDFHMEDEIEIEDVIEVKDKIVSENFSILNQHEINNTIEFISRTKQLSLTQVDIENYWQAFQHVCEKAYYNRDKKILHFRNWLKNQKNGTNQKLGVSEARIAALKRW